MIPERIYRSIRQWHAKQQAILRQLAGILYVYSYTLKIRYSWVLYLY